MKTLNAVRNNELKSKVHIADVIKTLLLSTVTLLLLLSLFILIRAFYHQMNRDEISEQSNGLRDSF